MDQALNLLPSDYWRWWLLSHAPETSDSEFTWENFQLSINKDLADVLGNFVSRVTKFCRSKFGETVPEGGSFGVEEYKLISNLNKRLKTYESYLDGIEIRKSASELRAIWALGNEYLQIVGPWSCFKEDPIKAAMQIRLALNLIRIYAVISAPFIPDTADAILKSLKISDKSWPTDLTKAVTKLAPGNPFVTPENLFNKISDEDRDLWALKFSGNDT